MSDLKTKIIDAGLTVAEVAARANTPTAHLYNLLNRVRRPRPELARKIETATNGAIKWTEFFPDTESLAA